MKRIAAVLLTFGLTTLTGSAQSLGNMAREQREVRSQSQPTERKITTETATAALPGASLSVPGAVMVVPESEGPGDTTETGTPQEAAPVESDQAPTADDASPETRSDVEEAWRGRFADARAEVQRVEQQQQLAELELGELNNQLLTRSDIFNREYQLAPLIAAKEQEIADIRQRLIDANQVIDDLRTELRQAGLPAGWGR